jgi:hypothetical protein
VAAGLTIGIASAVASPLVTVPRQYILLTVGSIDNLGVGTLWLDALVLAALCPIPSAHNHILLDHTKIKWVLSCRQTEAVVLDPLRIRNYHAFILVVLCDMITIQMALIIQPILHTNTKARHLLLLARVDSHKSDIANDVGDVCGYYS